MQPHLKASARAAAEANGGKVEYDTEMFSDFQV